MFHFISKNETPENLLYHNEVNKLLNLKTKANSFAFYKYFLILHS